MTQSKLAQQNRRSWIFSKWYGKVLVTAVTFCVLFVILNNVIMPLYTRHGQAVGVPEVKGFSVDAAEKMLLHKGFKLVRGELTYDDYYPSGFVLFQNPEAGAMVKKGRRIYVTISRGERQVTMPDLSDLNLSNARLTLKAMELELGKVELHFNSKLEDTIVVSQAIPEKAEVPVGTIVDLVCKVKSIDNTTVPDLIGISLIEAEERLTSANLKVGRISYQITDQLLPLTVIDQTPEKGRLTAIGESVSIVVSKLSEENASTSSDTILYQ